ncbi:hypothetical protein BURPS1106B_A3075 [Burkholderia pseudomallei 1106b]|uniref:Uncharacterized protein n=1 Tax=Burkholderia pseudomallei (strain 1106a) TaxID=357348 RepID=A3P0G9_BURP0|nr:hypothetical protein BURPS1106A_3869 [Burkholderia pseudomallei 1106a]ACQ97901.1 conserved hypothetical protein [Burkholderia pseudomallei MSHR346]AFR17744.1 hypothetical protein BPC006_I3920 [Burkholderia pseudomallei BPC006]EBA47135.1 hypothetical protein BURPS305_3312 [Burkholderia pseudomallei 305]EEC32923.1 conserved hypothetical protein [Burkholderia pseudomallei 576]EES24659.1 hypothetical protein BURPS1106B_A3075 [Burkholderia pseudomallei 1106b]VUD54828.1 unnamed protein product [
MDRFLITRARHSNLSKLSFARGGYSSTVDRVMESIAR